METFNHSNILTIDDIYDYSIKNNISVISVYRNISKLIKEDKISKVLFEYDGNNYHFANSSSFDTEIGFIKKNKNKKKYKNFTQNEIDNFF